MCIDEVSKSLPDARGDCCGVILPVLGAEGQISGLVWEDNFNNGQLDLTRWNIETRTGVNGDWGIGQLDRARAENVTFDDNVPNAEDGCLVITTKDEFYIDRNYTSGRINTAGKASWGPNHRIVARVFTKGRQAKRPRVCLLDDA